MQLAVIVIAWFVCGRWMFLCVGRTPKQCLQCVIGRYIVLMVVIALTYIFIPNH